MEEFTVSKKKGMQETAAVSRTDIKKKEKPVSQGPHLNRRPAPGRFFLRQNFS
jgi:hypothetical protein